MSKVAELETRKLKLVVTTTLLVTVILVPFLATSALSVTNVVLRSSGNIASISPLHIEGKFVKDNQRNTIILRGVNFVRFIDSPYGDWLLPNGQIVWATWNSGYAASNLDAMKSWGINVVRTLSTVEWWANNVGHHRQIVKEWASLAASRGIYVVYGFWRITGSSQQTALPYPPYNEGDNNTLIRSSSDFVNIWASVANELKNYPNVILELWNEPHGDTSAQTSWFDVTQQCITAIRGTGATNLIVVQWGYAAGVDFAGFNYFNNGNRLGSIWTLDWINQFPLIDPLGNILYSTHLYRSSFYDSSQGYKQVGASGWINYTSNDLLWALNITGVTSVDKALWIGEIGPNQWNTEDITNEYRWYDGSLAILNQNDVGYAAWEWWTGGAWCHLSAEANYKTNQGGTILRNRLAS